MREQFLSGDEGPDPQKFFEWLSQNGFREASELPRTSLVGLMAEYCEETPGVDLEELTYEVYPHILSEAEMELVQPQEETEELDPTPTTRTAGRVYSYEQEQDLINEEGFAEEQFSRLDLTGTHYV